MSITTHSAITRDVAHVNQGCQEDIVVYAAHVRRTYPGLAALFSEMQAHYDRPVSYEAALSAAVLACRPPVNTFDPRVLIALLGDDVVGSIVMNVTFPAFELSSSRSYIRDLYVSNSLRRSGVGRLLVKSAARLAVNEGFSALEWTTDSANRAARRITEICGAKQLDLTYYRLFDDTLRAAAV